MDISERVYFQYRSKPKIVQWYAITPEIGDELESGFGEVRDTYDIETAEGAQLDVIAAIVGTNRSLTRGLVLDVTQFADAINADDSQFGDENAQFSAGSVSEDAGLDDQYLRSLILWKISVNTSDATIESILGATATVMPGLDAYVVDDEDMTFSLVFVGEGPGPVDGLVMSIADADVVPRPQGVEFTGYTVV